MVDLGRDYTLKILEKSFGKIMVLVWIAQTEIWAKVEAVYVMSLGGS